MTKFSSIVIVDEMATSATAHRANSGGGGGGGGGAVAAAPAGAGADTINMGDSHIALLDDLSLSVSAVHVGEAAAFVDDKRPWAGATVAQVRSPYHRPLYTAHACRRCCYSVRSFPCLAPS